MYRNPTYGWHKKKRDRKSNEGCLGKLDKRESYTKLEAFDNSK